MSIQLKCEDLNNGFEKIYIRQGKNSAGEPHDEDKAWLDAQLSSIKTAVATFLIPAERVHTVDQLHEICGSYYDPVIFAKRNRAKYSTNDMCASHRKIYYSHPSKVWKLANFYFNSTILQVATHASNRQLLEPWLGDDYHLSGVVDGRKFSIDQKRIIGCIELLKSSATENHTVETNQENFKKAAKYLSNLVY